MNFFAKPLTTLALAGPFPIHSTKPRNPSILRNDQVSTCQRAWQYVPGKPNCHGIQIPRCVYQMRNEPRFTVSNDRCMLSREENLKMNGIRVPEVGGTRKDETFNCAWDKRWRTSSSLKFASRCVVMWCNFKSWLTDLEGHRPAL